MKDIVDIQSRRVEAVRSVVRYVAAEGKEAADRGVRDRGDPRRRRLKNVSRSVSFRTPGFDELPLVPSFAVNDHDGTLLAVRTQLSQDVVMKPVTSPGTVVKL